MGIPGNCLAMATACPTYSCVPPLRPKPVPGSNLKTSHLSSGKPAASAKAACEASPFCVGTQASARSLPILTVAFIGSILTCER